MISFGHHPLISGAKTSIPQIVLWCITFFFSVHGISAQALSLTGVQSRKSHALGNSVFDLPVDTTQSISGRVTIEPRAIGAGHRIVFQFDGVITSTGALTVIDDSAALVLDATVALSVTSANDILVTLPTLSDNTRVTISLANVNGVGLNVSASLGFRLGDTDDSGSVTATDVTRVKARSGQITNTTNFQYDLNTTGKITASDISTVKSRSGLYLVNIAPIVSAGANQTITLPAAALLSGTVTDDGRPNPPGALTLSWSRLSGPAAVTFGNPGAASTSASFAGPGAYVLRLTASDGELSSSADVNITVNPGAASSLTVSGLATPRTEGVAGTVIVTAKDAMGNTATAYTGTVHFSSSDPLAVLPVNYAFSVSDSGVHVFSVILNSVGTHSITVTDAANGSIAGSQTGITVNASVLPGLFEKPHGWNKDVSLLAPSSRSAAIISALQGFGGWGNSNKLQIDFSIALLLADSTTPRRTITSDPGGYCFGGPDCDAVPLQMPIPANGNAEGSLDYTCDTANGDCHVLVVERSEKKLYELYNATAAGSNFTALGAFVWDLTKQYGEVLRGDQCTSADAAGLPMSALIPTADEVAAGDVPHALRFILPNSRMKRLVYVRPATHAGAPSSTNSDAPPYGVRLRLKANFDESPFSAGARVILRAMKKYGMILSDGGNIALTFADDRLSTVKWLTLGITAQTFNNIPVTQFDVVDLGAEIPLTYDCVRVP